MLGVGHINKCKGVLSSGDLVLGFILRIRYLLQSVMSARAYVA